MKTADLYIRVSTDEQADKGYSQRGQEEVLRRYCDLHKISIRKTIFEDYSAKTFNRPEWQGLLLNLKKHRGQVDLILFTKWDRFSRNAPDAYQMINTLKILGVEPQAIEQPLNMEVPENKMMLAIYLTAPEIENDRRALNVFHGMRRAKKEGRWMATAPIGYKNRVQENGKKYIAFDEPQASIMKWAFEEISMVRCPVEQIWKRAKELGLTCNKNNFWRAIRNPVYCGKIVVPRFKEEDTCTVQGSHEALITESLFYEVQDVLSGGKKNTPVIKIFSKDMLPLKGFLRCPACSRTLCGSASKGRKLYYHYYHCCSACGYRQKAEYVNEVFVSELKNYVINPVAAELFKTVILDTYSSNSTGGKETRKHYIDEITTLNNKVTRGRELLLNGDIDANDYKLIKTDAERKIVVLEAKLSELGKNVIKVNDLEVILDKAISTITRIDGIYLNSGPEMQRKIIGSIYPEKFTFEDLQHRTAKVSEFFNLIYLINRQLSEEKNGTTDQNLKLSRFCCFPAWARTTII